MGYLGPEKELLDQLGLKKDARSNIETPIGKYSTNHRKVYAAGGLWKSSLRGVRERKIDKTAKILGFLRLFSSFFFSDENSFKVVVIYF